MIGSTDSHTVLSTSREDNYFGKVTANEPNPHRGEHWLRPGRSVGLGEHARSDLRCHGRKEFYATSGSRITVRVFVGWDFTADEVERHDFARAGYDRGVPMTVQDRAYTSPIWYNPAGK